MNNAWTATSTTAAPAGRCYYPPIWTGSEMIIWGGRDISLNLVNTGGRYNPQTDTWSATTTVGVPAARDFHAAVWTGNEMLVFGGGDGGNLSYNTAYSYAPPRTMWLYQRP